VNEPVLIIMSDDSPIGPKHVALNVLLMAIIRRCVIWKYKYFVLMCSSLSVLRVKTDCWVRVYSWHDVTVWSVQTVYSVWGGGHPV
jgi:hypothetical protein